MYAIRSYYGYPASRTCSRASSWNLASRASNQGACGRNGCLYTEWTIATWGRYCVITSYSIHYTKLYVGYAWPWRPLCWPHPHSGLRARRTGRKSMATAAPSTRRWRRSPRIMSPNSRSPGPTSWNRRSGNGAATTRRRSWSTTSCTSRRTASRPSSRSMRRPARRFV